MTQFPGQAPAQFQQPQQPMQQPYPQQQWGQQPGGYPMQQQNMNPFMNPGVMGMFTGMSQVRARVDREYIEAGKYWVRIDHCKVGQNRQGIPHSVVEGTVIAVLQQEGPNSHKVADEVTQVFSAKSEYCKRDIKSFVCGAMGMADAEVTDQDCMAVFMPDNPLAFTVVEVHAYDIAKKNKPNEMFTRVSWKREVPPSEIQRGLPAVLIERFFPGNFLAKLVERENVLKQQQEAAAAAAQASPPQPQWGQPQQTWGQYQQSSYPQAPYQPPVQQGFQQPGQQAPAQQQQQPPQQPPQGFQQPQAQQPGQPTA